MKSQSMVVALAGLVIAQLRLVARQAVQAHVLGLVDDGRADRLVRGHQVLLDLGLAVDGDDLAGEAFEVDAMALAVEGELHTFVDQPLAGEPIADAGFRQQVHGALLQQTGADAGAQVLGIAALQHHAVDAGEPEQPRQQQPRRPTAHNSNVSAHVSSYLSSRTSRSDDPGPRATSNIVGPGYSLARIPG